MGVQAACVEARASCCMELDSLRRVISCTQTAFAERHTRSRTRQCAREAPLDAAGEAEVADVLRQRRQRLLQARVKAQPLAQVVPHLGMSRARVVIATV